MNHKPREGLRGFFDAKEGDIWFVWEVLPPPAVASSVTAQARRHLPQRGRFR